MMLPEEGGLYHFFITSITSSLKRMSFVACSTFNSSVILDSLSSGSFLWLNFLYCTAGGYLLGTAGESRCVCRVPEDVCRWTASGASCRWVQEGHACARHKQGQQFMQWKGQLELCVVERLLYLSDSSFFCSPSKQINEWVSKRASK